MAYVHLPESGMAAGIAKIVGKLQGKLAANVIDQAAGISDSFRVAGCPSLDKLNRLKSKQQNLNKSLSSINNRLDKFRRLPKKLRVPVKALKVIIKIITSLPIPQAVPPGFGLPLLITTKYSDLLVKIREIITQIEEIIVGIEAVLDTPTSQLSSIQNILSRTESAITSCQTSAQIQEDLNNGNLNESDLKDLGLMDDDGITIFSTLGPLFVGNSTLNTNGEVSNIKRLGTQEDIDGGARDVVIAGTGSGKDGRFTKLDLDNDQQGIDKAIETLNDSLRKINDSNFDSTFKNNIKKLLDSLQNLTPKDKAEPGSFTYTAANGITYALEIEKDPKSPAIAPRRFGVARTLDEGVAVLKGQPSFSSDINVLLDEVKFRLDNQLP